MIRLTDGVATLELDPVAGGRVSQFVVDGLEVLAHTGTKATRWGSFVMAPWAGRIRRGRFEFDGTTYQLPTDRNPPHAIHGTVLDRPWSVVESSTSSALLECTLGSQWPWPGRARQRVALDDGRDADGIATGTRVPVPPGPWDDCFDGVEWPVSLRWPGALRLDVGSDTRYVVVSWPRRSASSRRPAHPTRSRSSPPSSPLTAR